jgi:protein TonB
VQGTVILLVTVRKDGSVKVEKVTQGLGYGLNEASVAAVETWKFVPAKKDGQPVDVMTSLKIAFSLR